MDTKATLSANFNTTRELLGYARLCDDEPIGQAAALIGAACVIVEQEVGAPMAPAALSALLEPTLRDWAARSPNEARR